MVSNLARNREIGQPFHRRNRLQVIPRKKEDPIKMTCGPLQMEGIFYNRPHNRSILRPVHFEAIESAAKRAASRNPPFHGFAHSQDIVRVALDIALNLGADPEICYAAAILRDMKRSSGKGHARKSAGAAGVLLLENRLPSDFAERVKGAILCSHGLTLPPFYSSEAGVVWEASRIFNMGAFGFESRLFPLCKEKNPGDPDAAYKDAARTYLALERQFRMPKFVEAIRESSASMHPAFREAGVEVPAEPPQ